MSAGIRTLKPPDVDAVVALSLRAWAPVFESFEQVLGPTVYERVFPDWLSLQAQAIRRVCENEASHVWVTERDGKPVGFVAVVFHDESLDEPRSGEIEMIAVDPEYQRQGIADALTSFALDKMRAAGCPLAVIATGGDPGHAPARRAYEKAGFTPLPQIRYYKAL